MQGNCAMGVKGLPQLVPKHTKKFDAAALESLRVPGSRRRSSATCRIHQILPEALAGVHPTHRWRLTKRSPSRYIAERSVYESGFASLQANRLAHRNLIVIRGCHFAIPRPLNCVIGTQFAFSSWNCSVLFSGKMTMVKRRRRRPRSRQNLCKQLSEAPVTRQRLIENLE